MNKDGQHRPQHGDLSPLLHPKVVAVVGVSSDPTKLGTAILQNVLRNGFPGRIYAIAREPLAAPAPQVSVVKSLDEIAEDVDVALFAMPAERLLPTIEALPPGKVRLGVSIASGFSEIGSRGRQLEEDLRRLCEEKRLVLIGPNCQGVVVPEAHLQMTFSPMFNSMVSGTVALVAQSGALGAYMANRLMQGGTGVRCFISSGNETCLDAADYVDLFGSDEQTSVILCYLEQLRSGARFVSAVRRLPPEKRVVVVKSGRTVAGAIAASTHTGAIASDDKVVSGVLREIGVLRAEDSAAAVDAATVLASGRILSGRRVGILSIAGGLAVELSDLLELRGFQIPEFSEAIRAQLKTVVPAFGAIRNPIDLTGAVLAEGRKFREALEILSRADVDAFAIISTYVSDPQYVKAIVDLFRGTDKPVIICWTGTAEQTPEALRALAEARVPVFDNTGRVAAAFGALLEDAKHRRSRGEGKYVDANSFRAPSDARSLLSAFGKSGRECVNEIDSKKVLAAAGLPIPRQADYQGPSVVKYCSDTHLHKTEHGLVRLGVLKSEVGSVRDDLNRQAAATGATSGAVLVEECVEDGLLEWFLGFKRDSTFGPVVVFGAGGIFAEVMSSPQIRLAPLAFSTAVELIKSHPAYVAISGGRNRPEADVQEFARVISRASQLYADNADLVAEMDLNPIIVRPATASRPGRPSVVIADAAIKLFVSHKD